ncbi:MAG: mycothiol conjugate amidase Mca [Acidimicrobiales bacterium]|jgi:mycothiol S-conjugate amidase|nr:mycothiol conjugate amidase Mca [Acidimicrobiales bacterium]MDP6696350.1 mycothiol conjugate amidase Mca [Acidimicrobiales bacterium]|tara:strand:- start:8175 stop:9140 length:966 start_codon:yes stop_codon:yes gene_type:complete
MGNLAEPELRLMTIHAHPDDEASKGAATVASCHAGGVHCVLVCCTGGEVGDILNPVMDTPEVRENLVDVRAAELGRSVEIIGYDELVMLGYRDSGMPDTEENSHPDAFANADPDEAIARLVKVIRRVRPHVIVTYPDDRRGYNHPDHLQVHDISVPAFEVAGDPDCCPEAGEPWHPLKLYFTTWSRARIEGLHRRHLELGIESPYSEWWFKRPSQDHLITTQVPVGDFWDVRHDSLLAHATQVDPESPFWFGLPDEVARTVHPFDDYVLAQSLVGGPVDGRIEDDLFEGIRGMSADELEALAHRGVGGRPPDGEALMDKTR